MKNIRQIIWNTLIALTLVLVTGNALASTYVLGTLSDSAPPGYSPNTFADTSTLVLRTRTDCDRCQPYTVVENRGQRLFTYLSASELGRSDYADVHYLIVSARISEKVSETVVIADNGNNWDIGNVYRLTNTLAIGVSRGGEFLQISASEITSFNLVTQARQTFKLPEPFVAAHIGTDNDRRWAMIGIDAAQSIWMGDGKQWTRSEPGVVGEHGDRDKVLSVFPKGDGEWVGAVYANINVYNKGVMLLYGRPDSPARQAWAINSDEKNYGFFPAVQWKNGTIMVGGNNSSDHRLFSVRIPEQVVLSMNYEAPPHTQNHQTEQSFSAMAGVSLASMKWKVKSDVENLSNVKYEIANTLFKGVNIEGRYRNQNLALSYLKNQTEDLALQSGGVLGREASTMLFGYVDFDSWIEASHTMRMTLERADLKGVATYSDVNGNVQNTVFNNQYSTVALSDIGERGFYYKGEYSNSKLPMAVGFSHAGAATVSVFDPEAKLQELRFGIGFDELAYAKRYETNFDAWYWSGAASLGFGTMALSDVALRQAQTALVTGGISNSTMIVGMHLNGEIGYLLQRRSKALNGFGHSLSAGVRFQGDYISRDNTKSDAAGMTLNRTDSMYGPFVRYNLIF